MNEAKVLELLRQVCLGLPEVRETVKWGHPTFEAGKKIFAVLDRYEGRACIAFRASPELQETLLADGRTDGRSDGGSNRRFFEAPYSAGKGWICLNAEGAIDKKEVGELLKHSYRLVALKRMLLALNDSGSTPKKENTDKSRSSQGKGPGLPPAS